MYKGSGGMGGGLLGELLVYFGVFSDILPGASATFKSLSIRILLCSFSLKSGELNFDGVAVPHGRRRGMRA
jgi:energy-converting hydrogenase Eha subunit B